MSKKFGYYLTITIKDLICAIMINEDRTEIKVEEVHDLFLKTTNKMIKNGVNGNVEFGSEYLKEFKRERDKQFVVTKSSIALQDGYNIEWLQENELPYMTMDKLELLGLIPQQDEFTL